MSGLSRRAFIIRSVSLGGAAFAAATLGSACAPVTPQSAGAAPTAGTAGAPRRGGTLTWGLWDSTDDIDPAVPTGFAALEIDKNVLDTLVTMDANQQILSALASKWMVDNESRKFTSHFAAE
jgi:peptide/nickel transport system substrate-binding protein